MESAKRPLAPHLQVYRLHLTMVLSGLHRITGLCLGVGLLPLSYWYVAIAAGDQSYLKVQHLLGSPLGQIALFGWTFCLFFHLCNGIRYLLFDAGLGTEHATARVTGMAASIAAGVLTVLSWLLAYLV